MNFWSKSGPGKKEAESILKFRKKENQVKWISALEDLDGTAHDRYDQDLSLFATQWKFANLDSGLMVSIPSMKHAMFVPFKFYGFGFSLHILHKYTLRWIGGSL